MLVAKKMKVLSKESFLHIRRSKEDDEDNYHYNEEVIEKKENI